MNWRYLTLDIPLFSYEKIIIVKNARSNIKKRNFYSTVWKEYILKKLNI